MCLSVHRGVVVSQHALQVSVHGGWYPSMHCRSPAPHSEGKLRGLAWGGFLGPHLRCLQAHTWGCLQAHTKGGLQALTWGVWVSQHALWQTPPQQMATTVGSMHPTGMHSCCEQFHWWEDNIMTSKMERIFHQKPISINIFTDSSQHSW